MPRHPKLSKAFSAEQSKEGELCELVRKAGSVQTQLH